MKIVRMIFVAGLAGGAVLSAHGQLINGLNAVVHDSAVTFHEVQVMTAPVAETMQRQLRGQPEAYQKKISETMKDNLDQLVQRQLILHEFDTAGYNLPESLIDEMVQERIRERFGDRASLIKGLQAQGITYEKYRKQVRDQFIVEVLSSRNVSAEVMISPHKIEVYYAEHKNDFLVEDEVKLRMIVLNKTPGSDNVETKKLADEILSKIKEGASFGDMASVYSQGSQKNQNGDWGWVERKVLRSELSEVAFALKAGETSDIIETPEAYYLMLVEDKKTAHVKPLTDVHEEIEKTMLTQERDRLRKQWIERLKKKTFVRFFY